MAASMEQGGEVVQAWVPTRLAEQLKRQAAQERRSISSAIRNAIEDQLEISPTGEGATPGGDSPCSSRLGVDASNKEAT